MIAALPMYDFQELFEATDALWVEVAARLREQGIAAPRVLTRGSDLHAIWTDPDLLLAQTCGYPLVTSLAGRVTLVATPCYNAPGCDGPLYRSVIVVRVADRAQILADLRGRRCAVNAVDSQSGMNALRAEVASLAGGRRFFSEAVVTGAHLASVEAVAQGRVDVAAIDCVTWAHLQRLRPAVTARVRVLAWTAATPGLPLVTSAERDAVTRDALIRAVKDVAEDQALGFVCDTLLMEGVEQLALSVYEAALRVDDANTFEHLADQG